MLISVSNGSQDTVYDFRDILPTSRIARNKIRIALALFISRALVVGYPDVLISVSKAAQDTIRNFREIFPAFRIARNPRKNRASAFYIAGACIRSPGRAHFRDERSARYRIYDFREILPASRIARKKRENRASAIHIAVCLRSHHRLTFRISESGK